jgi:GT2 family glycosyltransferase
MVSVIVITRNTREMTLGCVAAVTDAFGERPYEIIVVDNDSSDGSVEALGAFPTVRVISSGANLGYARAANLGAGDARGDRLLFVNSDVVVNADAIEQMIAALEADEKVGMVSPMLVGRDGRAQNPFNILITPSTVAWRFVRKAAKRRLEQRVARGKDLSGYGYFCGAAVMVRADAFDELGGFDERFFFYLDDQDFCRRLVDAGWKLRLVKDATVCHLSGASTECVRRAANVERVRGRLWYLRKHFGRTGALCAAGMILSAAAGQVIVKGVLSLVSLGRCRPALAKLDANAAIVGWFLMGMPARDSGRYRRWIGSW